MKPRVLAESQFRKRRAPRFREVSAPRPDPVQDGILPRHGRAVLPRAALPSAIARPPDRSLAPPSNDAPVTRAGARRDLKSAVRARRRRGHAVPAGRWGA